MPSQAMPLRAAGNDNLPCDAGRDNLALRLCFSDLAVTLDKLRCREMGSDLGQCSLAHVLAQRAFRQQLPGAAAQGDYLAMRHEIAVYAVVDQFAKGRMIGSDNWQAGSHGLERD